LNSKDLLIIIGAVVLAIGAVTAFVGGLGEVGYIQCVANSGTACTSTGSPQYITVFLANSEMLSVGLSVALIGAILIIGGSITSYLAKLTGELKTIMTPTRICPKCGTQAALTAKFCPSCGNKLIE
jgi:zinc-ribbon domain